jgi:hypothetical protein
MMLIAYQRERHARIAKSLLETLTFSCQLLPTKLYFVPVFLLGLVVYVPIVHNRQVSRR